ncbi:MAG: enolase C-terminal domain-like protein, partial [Chloroflexota bacterium]
VDAAGMYGVGDALRLGRALEPLNIGWFEAPVPPEDTAFHKTLAESLTVPIATDQVFNRWGARDLLLAGGVDVIQPDVCRTGGISECKRIADMADASGKAATPHVSIGSAIHFAASVGLAAALPNQTWMEYWYGANPIGNSILHSPLRLEDGYLYVPDGPGLGIEVNEDALRRFAVGEHIV